ncbi:MAG: tautomerase family protein [Chitinophagaceae bacterium]|nr:tautomerase family protein [Chitinophagaceae bacterium]
MPHIIVKLWPGQSEEAKQKLAEQIVANSMETLCYGADSLSVAFEEIESRDWKDKVYLPDIVEKEGQLYKKPGYKM